MDTRDQTLTKLTQLHDKSHPTHHRPASLRWNYSRTTVSIMKLVMEDGWWWRQWRIPSMEPRTDSGSALQRGFRAWRQLRIVKHDDFFSPIFSLRKRIYRVGVGVGGHPGGPWGTGRALGGAPPTHVRRVWAPGLHLWRGFFIVFSKMFREVSGHSENICFLHIKQHHGNSAENSVSPG